MKAMGFYWLSILLLAGLAVPAYAQLAPFAPYSSCSGSSEPDCLERKKKALFEHYDSEIDILEQKMRRLHYYDLVTNSAINVVVNARMAAETETQKAAEVKDPALRQRHLDKAKREQRWADSAARKLVGGTPETHREHRKAGRDAIEAKFEEDIAAFLEYQQEIWH